MTCKEKGSAAKMQVIKKSPKAVYYRCNACNSLLGKLERLFKKRPEYKVEWTEMSRETKDDFIKANHKILNQEALEISVKDIIRKAVTSKSSQTWTRKARMVDEQELRDILKGREDQIESVMAKAVSWHDELRDCTLYQYVEFSSLHEEQDEATACRSIQVGDDKKRKPTKTGTQEAKATKKAKKEEEKEPQDLTHPQKIRILKQSERVAKSIETLTEAVDRSEAKADFVPQIVLEQGQACLAALKENRAALTLATENAKANFGALMTHVGTAVGEASDVNRKMRVYLKEAA